MYCHMIRSIPLVLSIPRPHLHHHRSSPDCGEDRSTELSGWDDSTVLTAAGSHRVRRCWPGLRRKLWGSVLSGPLAGLLRRPPRPRRTSQTHELGPDRRDSDPRIPGDPSFWGRGLPSNLQKGVGILTRRRCLLEPSVGSKM